MLPSFGSHSNASHPPPPPYQLPTPLPYSSFVMHHSSTNTSHSFYPSKLPPPPPSSSPPIQTHPHLFLLLLSSFKSIILPNDTNVGLHPSGVVCPTFLMVSLSRNSDVKLMSWRPVMPWEINFDSYWWRQSSSPVNGDKLKWKIMKQNL